MKKILFNDSTLRSISSFGMIYINSTIAKNIDIGKVKLYVHCFVFLYNFEFFSFFLNEADIAKNSKFSGA